jgi:hypothetical protein
MFTLGPWGGIKVKRDYRSFRLTVGWLGLLVMAFDGECLIAAAGRILKEDRGAA